MNILKWVLAALGWMFVGLFCVMLLAGLVSVFALLNSDLVDDNLLTVKTEHAVGVVELTGEILSSKKFERKLKKFVDNNKIKAIVVRIDSPGGTVGASEEIYKSIQQAAEHKPIYCSLGSVAASGGLYAAVACDKIIANKGTLTGSIGVVLMMPNVSDVMKRFGVGMTVIKSGKFKDSGSPFRLATADDRKQLQSIVDVAHEQFVAAVAEGRKLEVDAVKKFADGRIIVGATAMELGLVDEIGNLRDAAKLALEAAGDKAIPEIVYPREKKGILSALSEIEESSIFHWLDALSEVRLLYQAFI